MKHQLVTVILLLTGGVGSLAAPVGTAFTYQGSLTDGTNPANGTYDFRFTLYDGAASPARIGVPLTNAAVAVSGGLFGVVLDFGPGAFAGEARWLEIGVRTNGGAGFTLLSPRQAINAVPYALDAATADSVPATHLTGTIADAQLSANIPRLNGNPSFTGVVRFQSALGDFSGGGAGLTNLNAANLTGVVGDNVLSTNAALLSAAQSFSGANTFKGVVVMTNAANLLAGRLSGDGSRLSYLNAGSLTGALSDAVLSSNVALRSADQIFGGANTYKGAVTMTNPANSFLGQFTGDGSRLANLKTTNLVGTVNDSLLSSNVALLNAAQSFTGANTFKGAVAMTNPANILSGQFAGDGSRLVSLSATNLVGTVSDARLSGNVPLLAASQTFSASNVFRGVVQLTHPANVLAGKFYGTGAGLTNLNADTLDGLQASNFWKLSGNTGTTPGTDFLGTTDNKALELKVNGSRGLRLEPLASSPNVIAGSPGNAVSGGAAGAAIGGGGTALSPNQSSSDFTAIGGGLQNAIQGNAPGASIVGGGSNTVEAGSAFAAIGGGGHNRVQTGGQYSTIGGGSGNTVSGASYSVIEGGSGNAIQSGATASVIAGGSSNAVGASATFAAVLGGAGNAVSANYASIPGGRTNAIQSGADGAFIGGGWGNTIQAGTINAVIGGGALNSVQGNASYAVAAGGSGNTIQSGADNAVIGGGKANIVGPNATYATIPGGSGALADKYGQLAFAGGSFTSAGDAQGSVYVLRGTSTGGASGELFLDGAGTSRRLTVPRNSAWTYQILFVGHAATGWVGGCTIRGVVANKAGTMFDYGAAVDMSWGGIGWSVSVTINQPTQSLTIMGQYSALADTVRWVATVRTAEVRW